MEASAFNDRSLAKSLCNAFNGWSESRHNNFVRTLQYSHASSDLSNRCTSDNEDNDACSAYNEAKNDDDEARSAYNN